jgi:hypothetical protein
MKDGNTALNGVEARTYISQVDTRRALGSPTKDYDEMVNSDNARKLTMKL